MQRNLSGPKGRHFSEPDTVQGALWDSISLSSQGVKVATILSIL